MFMRFPSCNSGGEVTPRPKDEEVAASVDAAVCIQEAKLQFPAPAEPELDVCAAESDCQVKPDALLLLDEPGQAQSCNPAAAMLRKECGGAADVGSGSESQVAAEVDEEVDAEVIRSRPLSDRCVVEAEVDAEVDEEVDAEVQLQLQEAFAPEQVAPNHVPEQVEGCCKPVSNKDFRTVRFNDHVSTIGEAEAETEGGQSPDGGKQKRKGSRRASGVGTILMRVTLDSQDPEQTNAIQWTFGKNRGSWVKSINPAMLGSDISSGCELQAGDRLVSINKIPVKIKSSADIASLWGRELTQQRYLELVLSRPTRKMSLQPADSDSKS